MRYALSVVCILTVQSLFMQSVLYANVLFQPHQAVVIIPVADAAGTALSDAFKKGPIESHYTEFPFAPDKGYYACLRMHQLKFNEVVTIRSPLKNAQEVECEVSNLFYLDRRRKKRKKFWTLKKNIMMLSDLEKKIDLAHIPTPIDMQKPVSNYNRNILTLVMPWYDSKKEEWYSAGTRFVRCPEKDTATSYAFYFIDYAVGSSEVRTTSKKTAIISYPSTPAAMRALFLKILKSWTRSPQGFIAYVYGGTSFTNRYKRDEFSLIFTKRAGRKVSFWQRYPDNATPFTGFDCSGMLLTAAQIAGMPYYLKNTHTLMEDCGRPLEKNDKLEPGDLIWYTGHVMVVSDVAKNKIIEAVGYEAGYGKVQELALPAVFEDIRNYDQLINAYHKKSSLKRLNNKGEPYRAVAKIKLLRLI